jgi:hypothetical protein
VHTLPPLALPHEPSVVTLLGGQVPKSDWQPVPQWLAVSPHRPPEEQHAPKAEPVQLYSDVPPQEPSGEGVPVHGGALQLP